MKKITKKEYIKELKEAEGLMISVTEEILKKNDKTLEELLELLEDKTPLYFIKEVKEKSNHLIVVNENGEDIRHGFTAPNEYYKAGDMLIHFTNGFYIIHCI